MKIVNEDIWTHLNDGPSTIICFTSNGVVKKNGEGVMGKGNALEAATYFPSLPQKLGAMLSTHENIPFVWRGLSASGTLIGSFPSKPAEMYVGSEEEAEWRVCRHMRGRFKYPTTVPGWACRSSLELIRNSASRMALIADRNNVSTVRIPFPGIGNGELTFDEVKEVLLEVLDDNPKFFFHTKE